MADYLCLGQIGGGGGCQYLLEYDLGDEDVQYLAAHIHPIVKETFFALGFEINKYSPYGVEREFNFMVWWLQIPYWYLEDFVFWLAVVIGEQLTIFWAWYSPLPVD